MVRPLKNPNEPLDQRVTLKLSKHQVRVMDALVAVCPEYETKQDLLRELIRDKYIELVKKGMDPVARLPEHALPAEVPEAKEAV